MNAQAGITDLIAWLAPYQQTLPWWLLGALLAVCLIVFTRRSVVLQRQLASLHSVYEAANQELVMVRERLAARDTELRRQQVEAERAIFSMTAEKDRERQRYEFLAQEHGRLQAELATEQTKALRIGDLTVERDGARTQLEAVREEKNTVEARLAALQSQLEEEHKALEERILLQAKTEQAAREHAEARVDELTQERDEARCQVEELRQEKSELDTSFAALQTKLGEERKSAQEKIALLEQAELRLAKEFENLANRIFDEKQQKFSEANKNSVEALLNPVRQQLTDFRKKVEDVYDNENKERASLRTEINSLRSLNERIGKDALNLTKALKGDSKARGNWGEMQLERLLEESGLRKEHEYEVQASHRNEEGQRFQPDVVIHLPERKDVIIDSKVSLIAYEQYHSAETDEERQRHLRAHIGSLKTHFTGLSAKNYDELIGVNSLDLVIMFVPIEPALLLAFEHESNLFSDAFARRILLVSPSTLMATLQIIHNIWRYEHQNRNAQDIAAEAGKLHDQFVAFVDALEKVGDQIKKAAESYDTAHKRLTSGRGNLVGRSQKLRMLGAKTKKTITSNLLEAAAEDDDAVVLPPGEALTYEEIAAQ